MAQRNTEVIDRLIELDCTSPKGILVVGDKLSDVYIHGQLGTGQEGCPKFMEQYRVVVPGGAANAARSLKHWYSKKVFLYNQFFGSIKCRYMVNDQCVFRHDDDKNEVDFDFIRKENLRLLRLRQFDAVLISDYDKGLLTLEFIREVIEECQIQAIVCVADVKREPKVYAGSIVKCNNEYARKYIGVDKWPYLMTRGELCPVVCGINYTNWVSNVNHTSVKCINHVGAGDCFAAHLTLALAYGFKLEDAAIVAHSAGRVYVQYPHNRPPLPSEIQADLMVSSKPE